MHAMTMETGPTETTTAAPLAPRGRRFGWIKRLVALGALALMLTGMLAAPAAAMPRQGLMAEVQYAYSGCTSTGGAAYISQGTGWIAVTCFYDFTFTDIMWEY